MAQQALQLDPRIEDALEHHRTSTGLSHRKVAMWMFLGGDTMFFGALLATFLVYQNNIVEGITREEAFSSLWLVSIMAFVLLASSFTMVLGLAAARRGDQRMMRIWLLATAACGIFFIGAQGFEFYSLVVHEDLTPQTNLFGASFMILTGFHGAHVTIGVIWLLSIFFYSFKRGAVTPERNLDLDIAALYWHFVDVVWIVIFTVVYLFGVFGGF
ncbi:MAG: heme-copper oxidase subunit III [Chloroflexi bacterium]|nr:heme-copper oxidase subunit III [Chloroflexota bacterium]